MKLYYVLLFFLLLFIRCSSSRDVLYNGKVYSVKGERIFLNNELVTESLSKNEKKAIYKYAEDVKKKENEADELERQISEQQDQLKNAKKELEEKNEKSEARATAIKELKEIQQVLDQKQSEFNKLKEKEKLSTKEIQDYEENLKKLKNKLENAKADLRSLD